MATIILAPLLFVSAALLACPTAVGQDNAAQFITETEATLEALSEQSTLAWWNRETDITPLNNERQVAASQALDEEISRRVARARNISSRDPVLSRKLLLLRLSSAGIIADPTQNRRLKEVVGVMSDNYSKACPSIAPNAPCLSREKIENELLHSRDPQRLRQLWTSWYDTARALRGLYPEYVELTNRGARDSGYPDAAVMSRAIYEVDPTEFLGDLDRLWSELRPLYLLLHAYVRSKLLERYGVMEVQPAGPIPMHLLGNLWGQDWEGIFDIVGLPSQSTDYDAVLRDRNLQPEDFVNSAERFFTSLGFAALPSTFRERSFFRRPRDNFSCHPSAWRLTPNDLRLKMCIEINWANFITTHHEMGHIFYFQSFASQPHLFRDAPNAGINEAIGDAAALSVGPNYLKRIGLISDAGGDDTNQLLRVALRKLARVPFGLMLQKWRWGVMSGNIQPDSYNEAWWSLVSEYQGLIPPQPRPKDAFDPGAKYHIANDTDYIRYFLADVLTFQIHQALSKEAGCTDPVHRCSIYESRSAGDRWKAAMSLGSSRPWGEALKMMSGESRVTGQPLRDYLAPLEQWLKEKTAGAPIGW